MPIAQGSPSVMLLPIFATIAIVLLVIATGAGMIWFASRGEQRPKQRGSAGKIFLVSLTLSSLFAALWVSVVESYTTHAWRNPTRHNTLSAVDDKTGKAISIVDVSPIDEPEDPFLVFSMDLSNRNAVDIDWNGTLPLTVKSPDYQDYDIVLSSDLPKVVVVRMHRN
jgi:hypothetical protein